MTSFQSPSGDGRPIGPDPVVRYEGARIALAYTLLALVEVSPLLIWMAVLWWLARP